MNVLSPEGELGPRALPERSRSLASSERSKIDAAYPASSGPSKLGKGSGTLSEGRGRPILAQTILRHTRRPSDTRRPSAMTEHDAGCNPKQPAEDGCGEDDPDERSMCRADDPIELHRARIRRNEDNDDDE